MNLRYRRLFICLLMLLSLTIFFGFRGENADDILSKIQKKYETIHDASVTFTQHVEFGVMKTEQTFSGKFFMKKGGKYRIEGEEQIIVTDGKSVWTYTKSNRQVVIDTYRDDPKSFSPDKVLVNVPKNYVATLLPDEKTREESTVLKLIPRDDKSQVKWMKIWINRTDWLMQKLQMEDISDNITTYTLSDIALNANLQDSVFRFSAPEGVEVIDLR
jgi:outer membrane lipoprotein carrier protein